MASTGWLAMMNGNPLGATAIGIGGANAFTVGNTILNNAYSYAGHTGNGFIWWFKSPVTGNLTDFLFNVSAVVNGGSSTVKWELRGPGSTGNWLPSATIIDSGTLTCTSVGFQTVTGRTAALIAGNSYALCFADPSGNTTNYAQLTNSSVSYNITNVAFQSGQVVTSPNTGFNTVSNTSRMMYGGVKIGGTWLGGSVLDTMNTVTSGTYERGCRFQVPVAMTLAGIFEPQTDISAGATPGTFTLYPDSSATGGTNLTQWVMPTQTLGGTVPASAFQSFPVSAWYDLQPNIWYRLVFKPTSATTTPRKNYLSSTVAGVPTTLSTPCQLATFPLGGNCYWTDAGTPATWVASMAYIVNQRVSLGGNTYICTVAGTSSGSGGPTGTGGSITDNTVTWSYTGAVGSWLDDTNVVCLMGPLLVPSVNSGGIPLIGEGLVF